MYISLAQGNVDPSRLDDYVAHIGRQLPNFAQRPGFRNAYHGVNRERARSVNHDRLGYARAGSSDSEC